MASRYLTTAEVLRRVVRGDSDGDYSDESEAELSEEDESNGGQEHVHSDGRESDEMTSESESSEEPEHPGSDNHDKSPIPPERQAGGERGRGRGRGRAARGGARPGRPRRRQGPVEPHIDWSDQYTPTQIPDFGEPHPGPTRRFPNVNTTRERDFFDLLFTDNIWELLVQETNKYYQQQKAADPNKHKRPWALVTRDEMEAFMGIIILMGIVKLPRFEMYWSQDKLIYQEGIANVMSQTRFLQIWRYFHLADNAVAIPRGAGGFDKIYRVRSYLNIILTNIRDEYRLEKNIAIDETMVAHKGKLAFKQYIKNKPTKWGIKLWVLSEARSGYVYRFQVYLGKEHGQQPEKHLARRVVRDLTVTETGKYYHLYMDNFYTDPHFFLELHSKQILACGTILMVNLLLSAGSQLMVEMLTSIVLQLYSTTRNIWAE
ncbi:hypothetical protein ACROYT_G025655 [Oculina patagonica]